MNLSRLDNTLMEDSWRLATSIRPISSTISKPSRDSPEYTERNLHDAGTSAGHVDNQFMEDGH